MANLITRLGMDASIYFLRGIQRELFCLKFSWTKGKEKKKDLKAISSDCLDTRTNTSACENDLDFIPAPCNSISSTLDL